MALILAIDPGPDETGFVKYHHLGSVVEHGVLPNNEMLAVVRGSAMKFFAYEMIASYGMPVGKEVFETCVWIGRFKQAWRHPDDAILVYRQDVKLFLCGSPKAKDGNVRQALLDRYERSGGGAVPQVGTKAKPGPLYGVSTHAWPALGVAIVAADRIKARSARRRIKL